MIHSSYIEISEPAIENNISFIQSLVGQQVTFSSVIKGNAYGHGIETYCPLAYKYGVKHFSASDADEAFSVYKTLKDKDVSIMIMGMIDNHQLYWAIEKGIAFYVFEHDRLHAAISAAKKIGIPAKIHLEIETGMNRTGFYSKTIPGVIKTISSNAEHIKLEGLCTHLAGAESIANYKRIINQQKTFKKTVNQLVDLNLTIPKLHMASSAATVRYPKTHYDLVRIGILQYGFFPTQEILVHYQAKQKKIEHPLKRIISWKTSVMDIKDIKPGQFVGYGTSYFTNKTTRIATIPVGYSSGYSRSLSNKGKVLIKGKRLDVIGTVNMNMMAVDISSAEGVEKGDEVILIGHQHDQEITVSSFSDYSQIINYELLTRLPHNIPRIVTR